MNRRQFIKVTVTTGVVIGVGIGVTGAGYFALSGEGNDGPLTLEVAIKQLDNLSGKTLSSSGDWDPAQIFNHCAQSVEMSMSGYAEHKSQWFKNTAGQLAFSLFSLKGSMLHGLSDPIPGAPLLPPLQPVQSALARLRTSLIDFSQYNGEPAAHFAYGQLSKQQYILAHVMHLNNHFQQIIIG